MPNENPSAQPAETSPGTGSKLPMRRVADATTLRALGHPVRIQLMEALGMHGTMTATEVAELIGETPTTCSFHLRQLAKYGFVEEAGGGKGRARPWRVVGESLQLTSTPGDTESVLAAEALSRLFQDRQASRYRAWRDSRFSYPEEWVRAATSSEHFIYMTAAELQQLNEDIAKLIDSRFGHRYFRPEESPPGSLPVEIQITDYPMTPPSQRPPASGSSDAEGE
jgi:DNA-binding transcriptional ArsR family regulator